MSLDLVIIGRDGRPEQAVEVGYGTHRSLIEAAVPAEAFPLTHRLDDYYDDASFAAGELLDLEAELRQLTTGKHAVCVSQLLNLCAVARASGRGVEAISD